MCLFERERGALARAGRTLIAGYVKGIISGLINVSEVGRAEKWMQLREL